MISVITPVYNGEKFIEACIQAVIDQECSSVEHIIVDGKSTDKTVEVIRIYAEKYPHIRWLSERDRGQSDAMNKGISLAKGEILAFLNADDFYEPGVLNKILEIFKTLPNPSLVVGNCNLWNDDNEVFWVNRPKNLQLDDLLLGMKVNEFPVNPSAYFYHSSLHEKVGLYNIDDSYAMDLDFLLKAVQVASVKYVDEVWGNFRMLEGTKTVSARQQGDLHHRTERLLKTYRKDLPIFRRFQVAVKYELYRYWDRITFLIGSPQTSLPILKQKLTNLFGKIVNVGT